MLHTLSLPLSLPVIQTHAHTTPHHTLAQSKSGRYELIRFLEVEEIGSQSRLEGVDSCSISNAVAVSSRQKAQRKHDHLSSCTYRVEFWGGGCLHWSEEIKKESTNVKSQRDRQGWRRWWCWNRGMQSWRKFRLWRATSEDVWVLEWCEHVEVRGLQHGLHSFELSEDSKDWGRPAKRELQ